MQFKYGTVETRGVQSEGFRALGGLDFLGFGVLGSRSRVYMGLGFRGV